MISGFNNFILHKKNSEFTLCRYTLGGFFLASYDDSPAGVFDEVLYYYCFRKLLIQFLEITLKLRSLIRVILWQEMVNFPMFASGKDVKEIIDL